ncbi:MAG: peptide deformylase [Patescibacteria group bacterium]|nr:peptide deformylase [Patescibacteria group bacterium]
MFNSDSLKIILGTNPLLRKKSKEVADPAGPKTATLIKQMVKTMRLNNGVGLSAIQIGEPLRIFIVEVDYSLHIIINPMIKNISKDTVKMEEGCLSFPGIFRPIERGKKATVVYYDQKGKKQKLKAKGMLARAIQHEYDHLEGILFLDHYHQ